VKGKQTVALLAPKQDDDDDVKAFVPTYRKAFSRQNSTKRKGEDGQAASWLRTGIPVRYHSTASVAGVEC
jgi:hypothetical protein